MRLILKSVRWPLEDDIILFVMSARKRLRVYDEYKIFKRPI